VVVRPTGVVYDAIRYLEGRHETSLERLKTVLRLPSVNTDPAYAEGMAATCEDVFGGSKKWTSTTSSC